MRKYIAAIIALASIAFPSFTLALSPTRIGTDASAIFTSSNPWTLAVDTGSTGSNRALVCIDMNNGGLATSMTYNGAAMTNLTTFAAVEQVNSSVFFIANPTTGSNNVVVNFAGNRAGALYCSSYQDMAQSSPLDSTAHGDLANSSNSGMTTSITTTVDSDIILTWIAVANITGTMTPNSPQAAISIQRSETDYLTLGSDMPQATAGSPTPGYHWSTVSTNGEQMLVSLKYQADSGGGATIASSNIITFGW